MRWIQDPKFKGAVPTHRPQADYRGIDLSAEEGFILSRVDGRATLQQICVITGLPTDKVLSAIAKLHDVALIEVPGAPAPAPPKTNEPKPEPKKEPKPEPKAAKPAPKPEPEPDEADIPGHPFAYDDSLGISEKKQREIHLFFFKLELLDFYELLALQPGCDAKAVQRGYRKISLKFHPDRFYGKELGDYKTKLEQIFRHVTDVYEYLSDDDSRTTYEEAWREQKGELAEEEAEAEAIAQAEAAAEPEPAGPTEPRERATPQRMRALTREQRLRRLSSMLTPEQRARLKSKTRETQKPTKTTSSRDILAGVSEARKARLSETRKKRRTRASGPLSARKEKAKFHYDQGIKALLDNKFVVAATNLKLACTFDPKNELYQEKYKLAAARSQDMSIKNYLKRAKYEESVGRYSEAARLYTLAAEQSPTANVFIRASMAFVKLEELKRAVDYAKKAKELEPDNADALMALARAYDLADMPRNALREAQGAAKLDPDNAEAKTLADELKNRL